MQLERIKKKSKSKLTKHSRKQWEFLVIWILLAGLLFPVCFEKSQCMYFGTLLIMKTKNIKSLTHIMPEAHSISTAPTQCLPNLSKGFSTEIIVSIGSCIWFSTFPIASYLYHKARLTFSINITQSCSVISTANIPPNTWAWDNSEHQVIGCAYPGPTESQMGHIPQSLALLCQVPQVIGTSQETKGWLKPPGKWVHMGNFEENPRTDRSCSNQSWSIRIVTDTRNSSHLQPPMGADQISNINCNQHLKGFACSILSIPLPAKNGNKPREERAGKVISHTHRALKSTERRN